MNRIKFNYGKKYPKTTVLIALSLVLVIALAGITFAWFQNYIDVDGTKITTGKMSYEFSSFYENESGDVVRDFFYSTEDEAQTVESVSVTSTALELVTTRESSDTYFLIRKLSDSIAFDVSLSFDIEGLYEDNSALYDYIGGLSFQLYDESADLITSSKTIEEYIKENNKENQGIEQSLGEIVSAFISGSLKDKEYCCFRMTYSLKDGAVSPDYTESTFPIRVKLCVAQEGALPGEESSNTHYAQTAAQLKAYLNQYLSGDSIVITSDIDYTGDLIITRPVKLIMRNSTLTVHGNLMYTYMYSGDFTIDTQRSGRLAVLKLHNMGGNFDVDIPNASLEMTGVNSTVAGKADVYVQGSFNVNVSHSKGLIISNSRICKTSGTLGDSSELVNLNVDNTSRISVARHTYIGDIIAQTTCSRIAIENSGIIESLNLSSMKEDVSYKTAPRIFIDSYGELENTNILLPNWAVKFYPASNGNEATGNTRIISNFGSGFMTTNTTAAGFKSDGSADPSRDDIEYNRRVDFVEKVDGDSTKIIVHYEQPHESILFADGTKTLGESLESYILYYSEYVSESGKRIAPKSQITEMTVICYGSKTMSAADYAYIRGFSGAGSESEYTSNGMVSLKKLDLSDAISVNRALPAYAFYRMWNLSEVIMSELDTTWGRTILNGTGVEEIRIPDSVETTSNDWFGVDQVRFVHTSYRVLSGLYGSGVERYLFVPDEETRVAYIASDSNNTKASATFIDATRYGDYFLRLNNDDKDNLTCEFVTYTGLENGVNGFNADSEKNGEYLFDFNTITVEGEKYKISSYDRYAMYSKITIDCMTDLIFSDKLVSVANYAFYGCHGIESVAFSSEATVGSYAFYNCDGITKVTGDRVKKIGNSCFSTSDKIEYIYLPSLSTIGYRPFDKCVNLIEAHIGVAEITSGTDISVFTNTPYLRVIFVHSENAEKPASQYGEKLASNLTTNVARIITSGDFVSLYAKTVNSLWICNLEQYQPSQVLSYTANASKPNIVNGTSNTYELPDYYYIVNENGQAEIVTCMLSKIDGGGKDYDIVGSIDGHTVTYLRKAVYAFTTITAVDTLKIPDGVTQIGSYAFYSYNKSYPKQYITADLNNTVKVGSVSFDSNEMLFIKGSQVTDVYSGAFQNTINLISVYLPKLERCRPIEQQTNAIYDNKLFENSSVRIAYFGPCYDVGRYIVRDSSLGVYKPLAIYLDTSNFDPDKDPTYNVQFEAQCVYTNTNVNSLYGDIYNCNDVYAGENFSNLCYSDWYTLSGELSGVSYSVELPEYIYLSKTGGTLELLKKSKDIEITGEYTTPGALKLSGSATKELPVEFVGSADIVNYVSCDSNDADRVYDISSIGTYAYDHANYNQCTKFTVASSIKNIGGYALRGIAAAHVDLGFVTDIGAHSLYSSNMSKLTADYLENIGNYALQYNGLKEIYLPSIKTIGSASLQYNPTLETIILGENITSIGKDAFNQCSGLKKIVILNEKKCVSANAQIIATAVGIPDVYVPYAIYDEYMALSGGKFGNIPLSYVKYFENVTIDDDGVQYYWNIVDGNNVEISFIDGTVPSGESFVIPSKFEVVQTDEEGNETTTVYTVISLQDNAWKFISKNSNVKNVTLPEGLDRINFSSDSLPQSLTAFSISSDNKKFKTEAGVLYSKNGKVLILYPIAKAGLSFSALSDVSVVAANAFYNAKYLTSVTFSSPVVLNDNSFTRCLSLTQIRFTSETPSTFVGDNIFDGCINLEAIYVPTAALEDYKQSVLFDQSLIDLFITF